MANSSTNLDLISASQASKEVTANALFDAGSPAACFGRRASTSSALTWGYYGGTVRINGVPTQIANGTLSLVASRTQQIEAGLVASGGAAISGISQATQGVVTASAHGFGVGDVVWFESIGGMTQLNNSWARIVAVTTNTFTINVTTTGLTAYTSGGTAKRLTEAAGSAWKVGKGLATDGNFVAPVPLYQVTAGTTTVTSYTDYRHVHASASRSVVSVAGSADVALTAAQVRTSLIELTGALTGHINVIVPPVIGQWQVSNQTTGSFTVTVKTPGGTGVLVAQGLRTLVASDGTNVIYQIGQRTGADQAAVTLVNADGEISGLTVSAPPTQAEVEALRDKCEVLADDVRALSTLVHALRQAAIDMGHIKGAA